MKRILVSLVALAACGDSSKPAPAIDAPPDVTPDAAVLEISGMVTALADSTPIAGAKICVVDHPDIACAHANNAGAFTLAIPKELTGYVAVEFSADTFLAQTLLGQVDEFPSGAQLEADADATTDLATHGGFLYPASGTGFIIVRVSGDLGSDHFSGTTATASSGEVVYLDAQGNPDPTLQATSAAQMFLVGDVQPGRASLTVSATGRTCTPGDGQSIVLGDWPPSGANTVDAFVATNALTSRVTVYCR